MSPDSLDSGFKYSNLANSGCQNYTVKLLVAASSTLEASSLLHRWSVTTKAEHRVTAGCWGWMGGRNRIVSIISHNRIVYEEKHAFEASSIQIMRNSHGELEFHLFTRKQWYSFRDPVKFLILTSWKKQSVFVTSCCNVNSLILMGPVSLTSMSTFGKTTQPPVTWKLIFYFFRTRSILNKTGNINRNMIPNSSSFFNQYGHKHWV